MEVKEIDNKLQVYYDKRFNALKKRHELETRLDYANKLYSKKKRVNGLIGALCLSLLVFNDVNVIINVIRLLISLGLVIDNRYINNRINSLNINVKDMNNDVYECNREINELNHIIEDYKDSRERLDVSNNKVIIEYPSRSKVLIKK